MWSTIIGVQQSGWLLSIPCERCNLPTPPSARNSQGKYSNETSFCQTGKGPHKKLQAPLANCEYKQLLSSSETFILTQNPDWHQVPDIFWVRTPSPQLSLLLHPQGANTPIRMSSILVSLPDKSGDFIKQSLHDRLTGYNLRRLNASHFRHL